MSEVQWWFVMSRFFHVTELDLRALSQASQIQVGHLSGTPKRSRTEEAGGHWLVKFCVLSHLPVVTCCTARCDMTTFRRLSMLHSEYVVKLVKPLAISVKLVKPLVVLNPCGVVSPRLHGTAIYADQLTPQTPYMECLGVVRCTPANHSPGVRPDPSTTLEPPPPAITSTERSPSVERTTQAQPPEIRTFTPSKGVRSMEVGGAQLLHSLGNQTPPLCDSLYNIYIYIYISSKYMQFFLAWVKLEKAPFQFPATNGLFDTSVHWPSPASEMRAMRTMIRQTHLP